MLINRILYECTWKKLALNTLPINAFLKQQAMASVSAYKSFFCHFSQVISTCGPSMFLGQ